VRAVADTGTPVVLVLAGGRPMGSEATLIHVGDLTIVDDGSSQAATKVFSGAVHIGT